MKQIFEAEENLSTSSLTIYPEARARIWKPFKKARNRFPAWRVGTTFSSILFYSILFYSILLYSILFYSILFYSILFYSILFDIGPHGYIGWRNRFLGSFTNSGWSVDFSLKDDVTIIILVGVSFMARTYHIWKYEVILFRKSNALQEVQYHIRLAHTFCYVYFGKS